MATTFAGVWRQGTDAHFLWQGVSWAAVRDDVERSSRARACGSSTSRRATEGGHAQVGRAPGVSGADAPLPLGRRGLEGIRARSGAELSRQNLRLVDVEPYADGGKVKWAGVWRAGDRRPLSVGRPVALLRGEMEGAQRRRSSGSSTSTPSSRAGYGSGSASGAQGATPTTSGPASSWSVIRRQVEGAGRRCTSGSSTSRPTSRTGAGSGPASGAPGATATRSGRRPTPRTSSASGTTLAHQGGQRLLKFAPLESACRTRVREPRRLPRRPRRSQRRTSTTSRAIAGGPYRWPVDDGNYVRLSALTFDARPFTLPFMRPVPSCTGARGSTARRPATGTTRSTTRARPADVRRQGRRRPRQGRLRPAGTTWSGNTIIVSHEVGAVDDAFRTIYMHLRNGPQHDHRRVPERDGADPEGHTGQGDLTLTNYKRYLDATGAKPKRPTGSPTRRTGARTRRGSTPSSAPAGRRGRPPRLGRAARDRAAAAPPRGREAPRTPTCTSSSRAGTPRTASGTSSTRTGSIPIREAAIRRRLPMRPRAPASATRWRGEASGRSTPERGDG